MRLLRTPEFDGRSVVNEEGGEQVVNVDASLLEQAELERLAVLIAKTPNKRCHLSPSRCWSQVGAKHGSGRSIGDRQSRRITKRKTRIEGSRREPRRPRPARRLGR